MKWLVPLLLFTAFASLVPCARAQTVSLKTSDDPVGEAVETTEGTLRDLGGSTDDPSETTSATEQTATDAVDSGTASTRFDRLMPRVERLLERIELGRNVRANLRRLKQTLVSLSARERARLLRLLDAEIRRLRAHGISPAERRRIQRLIRARSTITTLSGTTPVSAAANASTGTPATGPAPGNGAPLAGGVLRAYAARSEAPPSKGATPPRDGAVGPSEPSGSQAFPLTEFLIALCAVLLVIVGGLAIKEEWSA